MTEATNKLMLEIVEDRLREDAKHIFAVASSGFHIFLEVKFPDMKALILQILNEVLQSRSAASRCLVVDADEENMSAYAAASEPFCIFVGSRPMDTGQGIVFYGIQAPEYLVGSIPSAVEKILKYFNLDIYIEVFDAKILKQLRRIARSRGLSVLIDAVVQVAYYGGYQANEAETEHYLHKIETSVGLPPDDVQMPLSVCARRFLGEALSRGADAHAFVKSCLTYFAINERGNTIKKTSQMLNVTRTTLYSHLKAANQFRVSDIFDAETPKNHH